MKLPTKVYAIQHNVTKRIYIGSSSEPEKRYLNHMNRLKNRTHSVEDMQEDFEKYGEDFSFYILDTIHDHSEREKEYQWMDKLHSDIRGIGYNYKDHIKRHSKYWLPVKEGLPEPYKNDYVNEIVELALKCNDIPMLDLVVKLLSKTVGSEKECNLSKGA